MGAWIVFFFLSAMTVMISSTQTVLDEGRIDSEVMGAVNTLNNLINAQHRYYLQNNDRFITDINTNSVFINTTATPPFTLSLHPTNQLHTLDWLGPNHPGSERYTVRDMVRYRTCPVTTPPTPPTCTVLTAEAVQLIYEARLPEIATRVALAFGDLACVTQAEATTAGVLTGQPALAGNGDCALSGTAARNLYVVVRVVPVTDLPVLKNQDNAPRFTLRTDPTFEGSAGAPAWFEVMARPGDLSPTLQLRLRESAEAAAGATPHDDVAGDLSLARGLHIGLRLAPIGGPIGDGYQDHTEPIWGGDHTSYNYDTTTGGTGGLVIEKAGGQLRYGRLAGGASAGAEEFVLQGNTSGTQATVWGDGRPLVAPNNDMRVDTLRGRTGSIAYFTEMVVQ